MFRVNYTPDPADDLVLPDPRFEAPELLIPRKKPVGPVVVDWSNPLAQGLQLYMVASQGERDLAKSRALTENNSGISVVVDVRGQEFTVNDDQAYLTVTPPVDIGGEWTVASFADLGAATYAHRFARESTGGKVYFLRRVGSHVSAAFNGIGTATVIDSLPNDWALVAHSGDSSGVRGYVDGVQVGNTPSHDLTSTSLDQVFGSGSASHEWVDSEFIAVWDRKLSDSEHKALAADPYSILIPA